MCCHVVSMFCVFSSVGMLGGVIIHIGEKENCYAATWGGHEVVVLHRKRRKNVGPLILVCL